LWTSATYLLFGATLWQARGPVVAKTVSTIPVPTSERSLSERQEAELDPIGMF
jgi:hypothetical protein